jgi:hypothetical protein
VGINVVVAPPPPPPGYAEGGFEEDEPPPPPPPDEEDFFLDEETEPVLGFVICPRGPILAWAYGTGSSGRSISGGITNGGGRCRRGTGNDDGAVEGTGVGIVRVTVFDGGRVGADEKPTGEMPLVGGRVGLVSVGVGGGLEDVAGICGRAIGVIEGVGAGEGVGYGFGGYSVVVGAGTGGG